MWKEIILTSAERERLQPFTDKKAGMDILIKNLSEQIGAIERELWEELHKMFPNAVKLAHPKFDEWKVYVKEDESGS